MKHKPKSIEEAAKIVAFDFQITSVKKGIGPIEAFESIDVELPFDFPNDWRACDFASHINSVFKNLEDDQ